jgi:amidase
VKRLFAAVAVLPVPCVPGHPAAQTPTFRVVGATIDDVRAALASKQITCRALVEQYIRRIEAYEKSGPSLNAGQTINRRAVEDAGRLDATYASSGPTGPLRDATVVARVKKAGAVIIGKATIVSE